MSHRANSVFANPGVSSQCAGRTRDFFLENAISALKLYATETNSEAHCSFSYTSIESELFDEQTATMLLLLTSNAPMSDTEVRSTEVSAPLAG